MGRTDYIVDMKRCEEAKWSQWAERNQRISTSRILLDLGSWVSRNSVLAYCASSDYGTAPDKKTCNTARVEYRKASMSKGGVEGSSSHTTLEDLSKGRRTYYV